MHGKQDSIQLELQIAAWKASIHLEMQIAAESRLTALDFNRDPGWVGFNNRPLLLVFFLRPFTYLSNHVGMLVYVGVPGAQAKQFPASVRQQGVTSTYTLPCIKIQRTEVLWARRSPTPNEACKCLRE